MEKDKSNNEIRKTMLDLLTRIQLECERGRTEYSGREIYCLAMALREVNSVRATLPRDFFNP